MESVKNLIIFSIFSLLIVLTFGKSITTESPYDDDDSSGDYEDDELSEKPCEDNDPPKMSYFANCGNKEIEVTVKSSKLLQGKLYIMNYENNTDCEWKLPSTKDFSFKVPMGKCGLDIENEKIVFNVKVLPDKDFVTNRAEIFDVTCSYPRHTLELSDNIPQITIKNSSATVNITNVSPPEYSMFVETIDENRVNAIIIIEGYGHEARARNCYFAAKDNKETKYKLTDDKGCSSNSKPFVQWTWNKNNSSLTTSFELVNLIDADTTQIHCTVDYCPSGTDCSTNCSKARTCLKSESS